MERDLTVNGVALRIKEIFTGSDRPWIVFLHDSLGCIELWRDFPDELAALTNCDALIYDRQGYGKSDPFCDEARKIDYLETEADVLSQLLMQCGIKEAIIFGHSDGGSIALIAAAKYPNMIVGLITEGAHIFVEDITIAGIKEAVENYRSTDLKLRLQRYHGDKTDSLFWAWANIWLSEPFQNWNIENFLPQIECPALVIQGQNDEYGSVQQVEGIVKQVSGEVNSIHSYT